VITGGTDVHLVLVDLRNAMIHGQEAEDILYRSASRVNRNAALLRPPPADDTVRRAHRHLGARDPRIRRDEEFTEVADIIATAPS
jgi:glycine hydroxymethyltransferase